MLHISFLYAYILVVNYANVSMRKLGVEEWIVRLVQGMYANARSRVHVGEGYSKEFKVKAGHHGSVLSPLLFIIVLEALS